MTWTPPAGGWRPAECAAALDGLDPDLRAALELAHDRITAWHERQRPADIDVTDAVGARLGARYTAIDAAGIYVPGGRATYPSSVLMNAVPARVAGVGRLAMVTPTPGGAVNPLVLAAAHLAGVDEVWRVGGAAGGGGARPWHGADRARRRGHRPGQRLGGGGQAAGGGPGRHRHDRRPVGDRGGRRCRQRPRPHRRRPDEPVGTRPDQPVDPADGLGRLCRRRGGGGGGRDRGAGHARRDARRLGRPRGGVGAGRPGRGPRR